ncbi:MAG: hypothetical protein K9N35_00665 [Candidatus Marinimicrobia bacterium]|nr:hypothetical protein [Candidatus Neomarinimicrobiota bacterium]
MRLLFIVIPLISSLCGFELYHNPPEKFLQGVPGQIEVLTPDYLPTPDYVTLFLRHYDQDIYQELTFYESEGTWYCDIPAAYLDTDTLCYYIGASFGPAGLAAFPPENPESSPLKIPLVKFKTKGRKLEPAFVKGSIVDYEVTPWKPKPAYRASNFPVIYIPKTNRAFIESGYIKIIGNEKASAEDLIRSMMYLCLQENADAITEINISLLANKPSLSQVKGHIELEGVYLRRVPKD